MAMLASACALLLSGCSTTPKSSGKVAAGKTGKVKVKKGGGYYLDDGPMDEVLKDADVIHHCMNDLSKAVKDKEKERFAALCKEFGMDV